MKAFARTDIGKARDTNQDFYYIAEEDNPLKIYILADGMGGYNGGDIASKMATTTVKSYIESNFDKIPKEKEEILKLIKNAMEYANMVVYEKSKEDENLQGMGTTLEVCVIYNNKVYIGHIGDSRVYRIRKEFMRRLTTDHSYVQKLLKDGTISKEEAEHHPKKNMLMKALGCTPYVEPDTMVKGFLKGDILLICSDGLTNMLDTTTIYQIIMSKQEESANYLIQEANKQGGYDNITAIVILN